MDKLFIKFFTLLMVISLLVQNTALAKGPSMLQPDYQLIMEEELKDLIAEASVSTDSLTRIRTKEEVHFLVQLREIWGNLLLKLARTRESMFSSPSASFFAWAFLIVAGLVIIQSLPAVDFLAAGYDLDFPVFILMAKKKGKKKKPKKKKKRKKILTTEETLVELKAKIIAEVDRLNGSRPLWVRMYGFQATGKSTIANIIAQGIGALTAEDIEIIDDKEYDDYREGRMERLPQKDNPKVVIFLGLGKEMFKLREPSDINILVTADEQTIGRNMYQRRTGRDAEADMTPGLQAEIKRVVAVVRAEYRKLEDRRTRPDFTLNMNSNRRPSEDEIAAIFGDSDKLKQENIQQLQQLKRLLLTKSAEIAGARPLVLRIIGVGDSGKSVFAQALREGLSDVWRDGIYLYDDPDIVRLQQGRRYSKRYLLNEHPQARLVIAAGLIGIELLTEDDADINVFLEVDEETLKANFIEKHRNFPRQKLDMLLRAEGMISGLGRKATLEELCAGAFEDEDFDQEMSAIAPEKIDFKFNLSEGYRLTPAEIEACLRQAVFPEAALDKDSAEAIALSL